jgi:hypothetical protein
MASTASCFENNRSVSALSIDEPSKSERYFFLKFFAWGGGISTGVCFILNLLQFYLIRFYFYFPGAYIK